MRKYDLLRWNLFSSKLADVKAKILNMQANGTVPYGPTQILVPVPATQYFKATSTGITYARSLYRPVPATAPTGTTSVSWGATINATYVANTQPTGTSYGGISSTGTGLAAEYMTGTGKELLPIPQTTIDTDPNLKQNSGY
ncbi:MAG: RagB/SusD family nutrient uptake outer membrane protein [Hymenobacter sp.]|nr:MAG: RagB/SusD family nutrient uptake outer membrane protein [Hymenobacter sp.]